VLPMRARGLGTIVIPDTYQGRRACATGRAVRIS
jgi:hypothetical protein